MATTFEEQLVEQTRKEAVRNAVETLSNTGVSVIVVEKDKIPRKWNGRWAMIFLEAVKHAALNNDLHNEEYRVLLFLISELDWENWVQITQQAIANQLNMKQQSVARALKKLVQHGYISVTKRGRLNLYKLNSNLVWKGPVTKLHKQRSEDRTIIPFPKKEEDYPF